MLRRNEACLKSLRGFDEAAEAEDERGRRRLWVEYRRGGTASEGRGRHHVIGGYADGSRRALVVPGPGGGGAWTAGSCGTLPALPVAESSFNSKRCRQRRNIQGTLPARREADILHMLRWT